MVRVEVGHLVVVRVRDDLKVMWVIWVQTTMAAYAAHAKTKAEANYHHR